MSDTGCLYSSCNQCTDRVDYLLPFADLNEEAQKMVFERASLKRLVFLSSMSDDLKKKVESLKLCAEKYDIAIGRHEASIRVRTVDKRRLFWNLVRSRPEDNQYSSRITDTEFIQAGEVWSFDVSENVCKDLGKETIETKIVTFVNNVLPLIAETVRELFHPITPISLSTDDSFFDSPRLFQSFHEFEHLELVGDWQNDVDRLLPQTRISVGTLVYNCRMSESCERNLRRHLKFDKLHMVSPAEKRDLDISSFLQTHARIIRVDVGNTEKLSNIAQFMRSWYRGIHYYDKFEKLVVQVTEEPIALFHPSFIRRENLRLKRWDEKLRSGWFCERAENGQVESVWDCRDGWDLESRNGKKLGTVMVEKVADFYEITFFVWTKEQRMFKISSEAAQKLKDDAEAEASRLREEIAQKSREVSRKKQELIEMREEAAAQRSAVVADVKKLERAERERQRAEERERERQRFLSNNQDYINELLN